MRLRHIEVFSAIISTGSAAGAAKLLHISQPAVSKILKHAEQSLGFALFIRDKGKLVPTPEALRLRQELEPLEDQLRRIRRLSTTLAQGAVRPLRVAVTPAIAYSVLPRAIASWRKAFPHAQCELAVAQTREIEHALLLGETELGLTMRPISHPNLVATPVLDCHLCAIAPLGWWPEDMLNRPLQPEELANTPFVLIDADDFPGALVADWLVDTTGVASNISVQTYPLARALVENRVGVALVDSLTAQRTGDQRTVQIRPVASDQTLHVHAVTERSRPPLKPGERLLQSLREAAR
ncbi:LysR family transcriptional regulator [Paraburkholderia strydomiana]|uniref:LysR family transcriptional regulator n=1 Tax=Paraburkholderia strydomiana TaxID=1245417 RepID=UPI001BE81847|nr:LysR family transcriptional regulator [Paraburkholderia strydomiana]